MFKVFRSYWFSRDQQEDINENKMSLSKTPTAMAMRTPPNKCFNKKNNVCACVVVRYKSLQISLSFSIIHRWSYIVTLSKF